MRKYYHFTQGQDSKDCLIVTFPNYISQIYLRGGNFSFFMSMTRFDSVSIFPSPQKLLKSNYFMEHLIKVCLVLLLPFLFSGMVAACMIPQIILISYKKRLFDVVDKRKVHEGVIPRLGGVAFVPSIIISYALMVGLAMLWGVGINATLSTTVHLMWGLCALLLLYIEGVTDDLVGVGYKVKFDVQFVSALLECARAFGSTTYTVS